MRINKDLAEACMMLSFIILVLVGTTEFESETQKQILMGILGAVTVLMGVLRVIGARQSNKEHDETYGDETYGDEMYG